MARIGDDIVRQIGRFWQENFTTVDGVRHQKSLKTTDYAEARAEAGRRLERLNLIARGLVKREDLRNAVTLGVAHDHYMKVHGNKTAGRKRNAERARFLLEKHIGIGTKVAAIGNTDLQSYVAWRESHKIKRHGKKVPVKARTINLELTHLRAVLNMAHEDLGAELPGIRWRGGRRGVAGVMPKEARRSRAIIESAADESALRAYMDEDLRAVFDFVMRTAKRVGEAWALRWADVRRRAGVVDIYLGKKKEDDDRRQEIPLAGIADILEHVAGQHPELVFTYLCRRTRTETLEDGSRVRRLAGARYPWTASVHRDRWNEARDAAIKDGVIAYMTFHRATRATAITRTYLAEGPAVAQGLAGHASGETTRSYLGGAAIDIGRALERSRAASEEAQAAAAGKVVHLPGTPS